MGRMTDKHEKSFGLSDGCLRITGLWLQWTQRGVWRG